MQNVITGGVTLAVAIFFFAASYQIHDPDFDPLGPRFLPRLTLVPIGLIGLWFIIQGVWQLRASDGPKGDGLETETTPSHGSTFDRSTILRALATVGLLAIYVWALNTRQVPFEYLTGIYLLCSGTILVAPEWRRMPWLIGLAIIAPPILAYIFRRFLFVNLP